MKIQRERPVVIVGGGLAAGLISVGTMLIRAWTSATRDLSRLQPVLQNDAEPVSP